MYDEGVLLQYKVSIIKKQLKKYKDMEFYFEAKVVLELEPNKSKEKSKHLATSINLEMSNNLDRSKYLDNQDLPTAEGSKALSIVLIQGLVANIHSCHEKGFLDSAEHLRYIISELERGFVTVAEVTTSNF